MAYVFQGFQRVRINKSNQVCVMLMCFTAVAAAAAAVDCVQFYFRIDLSNSIFFSSVSFIHSFVFG